MTRERAEKILKILRETFTLPRWIASKGESFETLVITIISQNTTDKNAEEAYKRLAKKFRITPEVLAKAKIGEIEECIRTAGLYKNKAKAIKQTSQILTEKFRGNLEAILSLPFDEARKTLLQFPGIGPKTADVVLLFSGKPTIPVDTHVNRVAKRLGLAANRDGYEGVRIALQSLYPQEEFLRVHVLYIMLGRRYCRAINPLCGSCPVNTLCPSKNKQAMHA